jgi:hypothetical protein
MVKLIGGGRALRVCDICFGVDDHPRHTFAGGTDEFVSHLAHELVTLEHNIEALGDVDGDVHARLVMDFLDRSVNDRHMDCCASVGCPTGDCDRVMDDADTKRGSALLKVIVGATLILALLLGRLQLATVGFSSTNTIDAWLNVLRGTTFTGAAGQFIELHTADPGAAGTTAVSSVTTRNSITWSAPSGTTPRLISLSLSVSWTNWAGTNGEVVSHLALFSASSAGTFYASFTLTASRTVNTGDTLTLTSASISLVPVAA